MDRQPGAGAPTSPLAAAAAASGVGASRPPDVRPKVRPGQSQPAAPSRTSAANEGSTAYKDYKQREDLVRYRRILESVDVEDSVLESPAVKAVKDMLDDIRPREVLMAWRFFIFKDGRTPSASELLEILLDTDSQEENLIKLFKSFYDDSKRKKTNQKAHTLQTNLQPQIHTTEVNETISNTIDNLATFGFDEPDSQVSESESTVKPNVSNETEASKLLEIAGEDLPDGFDAELPPQLIDVNMLVPGTQAWLDGIERVLRREQTLLGECVKCSNCGVQLVSVTMLPCSHLTLCSECAKDTKSCPKCGAKVLAEAKTFLV